MPVPYKPHQPFDGDRPFWISDHDEEGRPADPQFLEAAYSLGSTLLRYRQNELRDKGRAVELLEKAVHSASNSEHKKPVSNFPGYLVRRFTSLVDTVLRREKQIEYEEPQTLAERYALDEDLKRLDNDILLTKIMSFMDSETRRICMRILDDYSIAEIARELGVTPNSLYTKFRRGCKKAIERLEDGERGV